MKTLETAADVFTLFGKLDWACAHHAPNLIGVWPRVFATATKYAERVQRFGDQRIGNQGWVWLGGKRYAISGKRDPFTKRYCIVVKERSNRGPVVASFDEHSTPEEIETAFKSLKSAAQAA